MKKLLILLAAILFGVSASFSQGVYIVNVPWDASNCSCDGTISGSYFQVTVSIFDVANQEEAVPPTTVYTTSGAYGDKDIDVSKLDEYCNEYHEFTPSFTVYAWVYYWCNDTNPPTVCCSGTHEYAYEYTCHDFYNSVIELTPDVVLNP